MNKKKTLALLFGFYTTTFIASAFSLAYMLTFLAHLGYSEIERGVLVGSISFVAILSPIIFGYLCDRFNTVKKVFNVALILTAIVAFVFYQTTEQMFFLHLIFYAFLGGLANTVMILQDTWVLEIDNYFRDRFGPVRAFGAIGWMIANPIAGFLIESQGYGMLSWVFAGLTIFNLGFTMLIPDAKKETRKEPVKFKDLQELLRSKQYVLVVLIFLCINMMAMSAGVTTVEKLLSLGAQEGMVGIRNSIQAFVELPLFFGGTYLLFKVGDFRLMMFATLMYIIRFIGYGLVGSPELVIAVSLLQVFTFPLFLITSKTLVTSASPSHLKSSGQTLGASVFFGIPSLVAPILSGVLMTMIGIDNTFFVIALFGVVALILGVVYKRYMNSIGKDILTPESEG